MRDDEHDDDLLTPVERYGWKPGEKEQADREMAERRRQIDRAEMLAWCEQRNLGADSTKVSAGDVATKDYGAPVTQHRAAAVVPASLTKEWQDYIERRIRKETNAAMKSMAGAVADTVGKDLVTVERDCAALRAENAELNERVTRLDNEIMEILIRQRAEAQFGQLNERIKQLELQLEATPARLRLLG